ncbi:hypothetical protein PM082_022937 [Marasmius tenuissimus]|nr:hypothetical protein PM082_022937 [Marasmius tenuissimus]
MHVHFGGSEVKMNEEVYPLESSSSNSLESLPLSPTDACVSSNAHLKWHGITRPPLWLSWLGLSLGMDKFWILDTDYPVFKRVIDDLVSQVPGALIVSKPTPFEWIGLGEKPNCESGKKNMRSGWRNEK